MAREESDGRFEFIDDPILRANLQRVFEHIDDLYLLSSYQNLSEAALSSFRKTIIIYVAAETEGILLWILQKHTTEEECAVTERTFRVDKHIYQVSDSERIVLGTDKLQTQKFSFQNANLAQVAKLCRHFNLIDEYHYQRVQQLRRLRNRQHVGGLQKIDKDYSSQDLRFAFEVAQEIKYLGKEKA